MLILYPLNAPQTGVMMSEMSKILYQEVIMDHNKNPHHFGKLEVYSDLQVGNNASCGDKLALYVLIENNKIIDIGFTGEGCAIFKSSTSMMTDTMIGKTKEEALNIILAYEQMLTSNNGNIDYDSQLGKISLFEGVKQYPARVKCAMLAYRTLESILQGEKQEFISTEY